MAGISGETNVTPGGGISQAAADARYAAIGITAVSSHVTVQFDKTNNTLADVPGLSITLTAGAWAFRAEVPMSLHFIGAGKVELTGTAVLTAGTDNTYLLDSSPASGGATPFAMPLSTPISLVTIAGSGQEDHRVSIAGSLIVGTGGTVKIQFAQAVTNATASSILKGAYMVATPIS